MLDRLKVKMSVPGVPIFGRNYYYNNVLKVNHDSAEVSHKDREALAFDSLYVFYKKSLKNAVI